jgi:hypothetical protein
MLGYILMEYDISSAQDIERIIEASDVTLLKLVLTNWDVPGPHMVGQKPIPREPLSDDLRRRVEKTIKENS